MSVAEAPVPATPSQGRSAISTADTIAKAARALFYEKGFYTCSVDEIARRAGLSRATIYLHFRNKDEILLHLLKGDMFYLMQQYEQLAGLDRLSLPAVRKWLLAYRQIVDERRGSVSLFSASISLTPELLRHVDHHRDQAIQILGRRFRGFDLDALERESRAAQRLKCYMVIFMIEQAAVTFSAAPSAPSFASGVELLSEILLEFLKTGKFRME
jgi:AcrR family transcriptional regulator